MTRGRITYRNWIVEYGRDPELPLDPASMMPTSQKAHDNDEMREAVRQAVEEALDELPYSEREFIIRFHFMGESYRHLAEETGREIHKLEALHRRALRRLKNKLAPFVAERFGLGVASKRTCPICNSDNRSQIDGLIKARNRRQTWRPVMRQLRSRYGIVVKTPQILIGHEKYH